MGNVLLLLVLSLLFSGCSREESDKKSEELIKVEQKVAKSKGGEGALICLDAEGKITCKLMTLRVSEARSVRFNWRSPVSPDDDRERTLTLPANHASIFDTRSKEGRAKGTWNVTAELGGEAVSTTFTLR